MPYTKFGYSKRKLNQAGLIIVNPSSSSSQVDEALKIINDWRKSHSWPLNVLYVQLNKQSRKVFSHALVAQRLKRMRSIHRKIPLMRKKDLRLSEMQDVAGCRAIMNDVKSVHKLANRLTNSAMKHRLLYTDDYIREPKFKSGYRGLHLIYSYYSDKTKWYNGQRIEIQLRTPLQHAWATAVETVDTFTNQVLKSNQGSKDWITFFKLISAVIAIREDTATVQGMPNKEERIRERLRHYETQQGTIRSINNYRDILQKVKVDLKGSHYYLLVLDAKANTVTVRGYRKEKYSAAHKEYLNIERHSKKSAPHIDAVLVAARSLPETYPNYFMDMRVFSQLVSETLRD